MNQPQPRPVERMTVTLVLTAALGLSAALSIQRLLVESRPRPAGVALPEDRILAAAVQDPDLPRSLQAAGVTALVRRPHTLDELIRYGLAEAWHPEPDLLEIGLADSHLSGKATVYLTGQLGLDALQIKLREDRYIFELRLPERVARIDPSRYVVEVPYGPMPEGFQRVLLLPGGDWGRTRDLNQYTQAIYSLKPDLVMPEWRGGFGARDFYHAYFHTPWLRRPIVALPEFGLPRNVRGIVGAQDRHRFSRVHVIGERDAATLTTEALARRSVRAVRERNVDWIYLEPPEGWDANQLLSLAGAVSGGLRRAGFSVGPVEPLRRVRTGYLALSLIYLGIGALFFLFTWQLALWAVGYSGQDQVVDRVLTIKLKRAHFRWGALVVAGALLILHWEGYAAWGGKFGALLLAVMAPWMALAYLPPAQPRAALPAALRDGLKDVAFLTGWSLAAGLTIGVLLFQPEFRLRLDGFMGVKAAYVLPLAGGVVYLFPSLTDAAWWRLRWRADRRWWTLVALLLLAGLTVALLIRSGNAGRAWLLPWETRVRDGLETLLGVRPRFKEWLIGYPLLLIGLTGRRLRGRGRVVWPDVCVALGLLGPVSLINTFTHIHTPLALSLQRSLAGWVLGLAVGAVGTWLVWWVHARRVRA